MGHSAPVKPAQFADEAARGSPTPTRTTARVMAEPDMDGSGRRSSQKEASTARRVLCYSDLGFAVKDRKTKQMKNILQDVSGRVDRARVLAILGPSGAGKTTLLSLLTLRAPDGEATGVTTLGGRPLTPALFRKQCFYVAQSAEEAAWPTLTPREQLTFAQTLFEAAGADREEGRVDAVLKQLGLESCADTVVRHELVRGGLSGGQKKRLAVAVALIKRAVCMFLDEPTSGLDAAAALRTATAFREVADSDDLIVVVTIHQPSTSVFATFDQLLLLSEGRTAYCGEASKATDYFAKLEHPLPPLTNPADFLLELVNSDFVPQAEVQRLLDAWAAADHAVDMLVETGGDDHWGLTPTLCNTFVPVFKRQATLLSRDVLTLGIRAVCFLFGNLYFSAVYVESRERHQDQVANRMWLIIWYLGVPSQLTVLVVFALNLEARIVRTEVANGMVAPSAYLAARAVLEIPLVMFLAFAALGLPAFAAMDFTTHNNRFLTTLVIWFAQQYCWDCYAACLAVAFPNPLLGAAQYIGCWFSGFLFGGFLIPVKDIVWPLRVFHYLFPLGYAARGMTYSELVNSRYDACDKYDVSTFCFCDDPTKGCGGREVLRHLKIIYPLFSDKNTLLLDLVWPLGLAFLAKMTAVFLFAQSCRGTALKTKPANKVANGH